MELVLASASPRRRDILTRLRIPFRVAVTDVDETWLAGEDPVAYVLRMATEKARAASHRPDCRHAVILAADTTVVVDRDVLGKPTDDRDAVHMMQRLSGRSHEVMTAIAVRLPPGDIRSLVVTTRVEFRTLSPTEIERYVASGEGRDKAGGYAVQGIASGFVRGIYGSFDNVVGLPAVETVELLREVGGLGEWP